MVVHLLLSLRVADREPSVLHPAARGQRLESVQHRVGQKLSIEPQHLPLANNLGVRWVRWVRWIDFFRWCSSQRVGSGLIIIGSGQALAAPS